MIETWGSFARVARPGLRPVWCCLGQGVAGRLDTALQHQEVQCECQTADGVFVEIVVSEESVGALREPSWCLAGIGGVQCGWRQTADGICGAGGMVAAAARWGLEVAWSIWCLGHSLPPILPTRPLTHPAQGPPTPACSPPFSTGS